MKNSGLGSDPRATDQTGPHGTRPEKIAIAGYLKNPPHRSATNPWDDPLEQLPPNLWMRMYDPLLSGVAVICNHQILFCNDEFKRIFGNVPSTLTSFTLRRLHGQDMVKVWRQYLSLLKKKSGPAELTFRTRGSLPSAKGGFFWVRCRANLIKSGTRTIILVNVIDITELKQLEHQVIIKNKMLSLGKIAAGIAHEIRNPLTGINNFLYSLEEVCAQEVIRKKDTDLMRSVIRQMKNASFMIETVIKRVMDFSKPGQPKLALSDLNECITNAVSLCNATFRKHHIDLSVRLQRYLPKGYVDPVMIEQVILNLMTNSVNSMETLESQRIIEVETYAKENSLCIKIADSGTGVPNELREKIFDPFFTTKEDGAGIGLNIAQRIVADHNGSLSVGTSRWGGAEFLLEIPIERRLIPRKNGDKAERSRRRKATLGYPITID